MKIILFTHPSFLTSQSMPRFAAFLSDGMKKRGHEVEIVSPKAVFFIIPLPLQFKKWLGYIDQYLLFPVLMKLKLRSYDQNTLFVFADQALGPWVPLAAAKPHVIHCHDFLAQRSAMGEIAENPVSKTGTLYQKYIREGYLTGKNFISVSKKTQTDLHDFYGAVPQLSEVVYNGISGRFGNADVMDMRARLSEKTGLDCGSGYILHVGGNQWYKNRPGVVEIYTGWRRTTNKTTPLLLVGAPPNQDLITAINGSEYRSEIHCLSGMNDDFLKAAYTGASVFLFPSLAEGFGWPIAEAMASGVPVITTNEAPMTEVAGQAAVLISKRPLDGHLLAEWIAEAASKLEVILNLTGSARNEIMAKGHENVKRFDSDAALDVIERIYLKVLEGSL